MATLSRSGTRRSVHAAAACAVAALLCTASLHATAQGWIGVLKNTPAENFDDEDLKLARMSRAGRDGDLSLLDLHYVVATRERGEHFDERHTLRLHSRDEYRAALADAGLTVEHDPEGLIGRGLWIGTKPR